MTWRLLLLLATAACSAPVARPLPQQHWLPSPDVAAAQPPDAQPSDAQPPDAQPSGAQPRPPVPAPTASERALLDLPTVLRLAGTKPLAIEVAKAQAQAAAADETRALARFVPALRPSIAFNRVEGRVQNSPGLLFDTNRQSTFGGATVDLTVNPGDAWFDHLAAVRRTRAAELGVQAAQHLEIGRAVRLYYDLVQARATVQIASRALAHAQQLLQLQEARWRGGRAVEADVLRAKAHVAAAEGTHASQEAFADGFAAELATLLLLPDDLELVPADPAIAPIRLAVADRALPELLARALRQRPDLRAAEALADAATAEDRRAEYGWLFPELRVGAVGGGFGATPSDFNGREEYFAALQWELGLGGIARSRRADAQRLEALARAAAVGQRVRAELIAARAAIRAADARVDAAQRQAEAADAALRLVEVRHRQGDALLVEVLDADRSTTAANTELIAAICAHNRAQLELVRLVGGPLAGE